MNNIKNMKGFTLAEATTVLIILGVIAALTIPSLLNRQKEVAERAKLKKAWEIYDAAISSMRADHPMMTKEAFTAWANQPNCPNTVSYFKTVAVDAGNGCSFKTPDGVWFDISDVLHPIVTLDANNHQTEKNTFTFVVSYDANNLTFRVNDPTFSSLTNTEKADLKKLFAKLDETVDIKISKWVENSYYGCSGGECFYGKFDYDSNWNPIIDYYLCDSNGNNCRASLKYDYDSNGNKIAEYWYCDGSGNNCIESKKYDYDSNGNKIAEYYCDGSGNNCWRSYYYKYDYDSNGNKTAYYFCDSSGNNCRYAGKYDYDSNGNMIAEYSGCDSNGNNCRSSNKYEYDSNGNKIAEYWNCNGNGNGCSDAYKTIEANYVEIK